MGAKGKYQRSRIKGMGTSESGKDKRQKNGKAAVRNGQRTASVSKRITRCATEEESLKDLCATERPSHTPTTRIYCGKGLCKDDHIAGGRKGQATILTEERTHVNGSAGQ